MDRAYRLGLFISLLASPLFAQQADIKDIPDPAAALEEETFQIAEGFEINLYASDPMIAKPIHMNFDSEGRLWVVSSSTYPQIKPGENEKDQIIVLEDADGDGVAEKSTSFADGLLVPTGLEPGDGGVYAANSTEILHLRDTDGDGKADQRRVVLSGFGTEDTHHIIHTFRWGPDQRLYFNQSIYIHSHVETPWGVQRLNAGGIWRFQPETMRLEVFARGFVNSWGHHINEWGQSFATDGAYQEGINYVFPGAAFLTAKDVERIMTGLNPGSPKHCGLEILSGRHLPDDWQGNMITNDFRGHRVCRFVVSEEGSGYASREQTELIKTRHVAFRPIDVKMGPDGAIYVADWYNPIIQHGEVDFRDPRRDHVHGRIWRVTAKGRPLVERPKIVGAPVSDLLELLKVPEGWTRQHAKRELKERGPTEVIPAVNQWVAKLDAGDKNYQHNRLEALWVYHSLNHPNLSYLNELLHSPDHHVRAAAVRLCNEHVSWAPDGSLTQTEEILAPLFSDENAQVRLEAVRAASQINTPEVIGLAARVLDQPMDKNLDYALWLTSRELAPKWLPELKNGSLEFEGKGERLLFVLKSVGTPEVVPPLMERLENGKIDAALEPKAYELVAELGGPKEMGMILDQILKSDNSERQTNLLNALIAAAEKRNVRPERLSDKIRILFNAAHEPLKMSAIRAAGLWQVESSHNDLVKIAGDPRSTGELQQAAVDSIARIGGDSARQSLMMLSSPDQTAELRMRAVVGLSAVDTKAAAERAVAVLSAIPAGMESAGVFAAFLGRKEGPEALAEALKDKKLPTDVARVGLRRVNESGRTEPALTSALTQAAGLDEEPEEISSEQMQAMITEVKEKGDPARGEIVFRREDAQCFKCHAIAGAGGKLGPDMSSLGAVAQIDYLIESILIPNKAVKEGFHSVNVTTKDGEIISGIKLRETGTALIVRNAENDELSIPMDSIAETAQGISLMPTGAANLLTHAEFIDLIRFLSELGKEGPYAVKPVRLARTWRVLQNTPQSLARIHTNGFQTAANTNEDAEPTLIWGSAYAQVTGVLPIEAIPKFNFGDQKITLGFARCEMEVTTPGKVTVRFNSVEGLRIWSGENPLEPTEEITLNASVGIHTLTIAVDPNIRKEPLSCELVDEPGSEAHAQWVGGK